MKGQIPGWCSGLLVWGEFVVSRSRGRECAERLSVAFDNFGWLREQGLAEDGRAYETPCLGWVSERTHTKNKDEPGVGWPHSSAVICPAPENKRR